MVFARWDPFRDLIRIQHGLERLASHGPQGWAPAVDLSETAEAFVFTAELPGLTREQVRIDVHENRLTSITRLNEATGNSSVTSCCPTRSTPTP